MRKRAAAILALVGAVTLVLWSVLACSQARKGASPEEFYRGNAINWIVSSTSGTSTDLLARAVSPYLAKETGSTVKIEAMGPDEGRNYVFTQGKRDGTTLVINSTNALISNDILKAPGVLYEAERFNYVADVAPSCTVFQISPRTPFRTLELLRLARGLKAGGTTAKGNIAVGGALMLEILGLDGKVITGFNGKKELTLALGRGEVDFMVTSDESAMKDEKDGYLVNMFVLGDKRSPALPNVRTMQDLGVDVPKELQPALAYLSTGGTAVALPPDVPRDRVEYLRGVFQRLSENKDLQGEIEKLSGVWRPFTPGQEVQTSVASIKASKELANQIDAIFKKHSKVQ